MRSFETGGSRVGFKIKFSYRLIRQEEIVLSLKFVYEHKTIEM